jgi:hypothetical protein
MPWLAKYERLATRLKTVTMFVVVTRDSRSQDSPRTSSTSTANAVPNGMRPFRNSPIHVAVRQRTMRSQYWSGKLGPTSFKRYLPNESATFSKID